MFLTARPCLPHSRAVVEFDLFMRVGHLGIFGLVRKAPCALLCACVRAATHDSTRISCLPPQVLAGRYFTIIRMPKESVSCENLLDFFAMAG